MVTNAMETGEAVQEGWEEPDKHLPHWQYTQKRKPRKNKEAGGRRAGEVRRGKGVVWPLPTNAPR